MDSESHKNLIQAHRKRNNFREYSKLETSPNNIFCLSLAFSTYSLMN